MPSMRFGVTRRVRPFGTSVPARVALVLLALVAVPGLAACGGADAGDAAALEGRTWLLDQDASAVANPVEAARVTADFADGGIVGSAGCNRYRAAYRTDGTRMAVDDAIATTRMLCTPENLAIEADYLERLASTRSWTVDGDRLVLTTATDDLVLRSVTSPS